MSSLRNWSKAGNSQDGSDMQLCPRCCLNCLTSQPLCSAWGGNLNRPWSQWVFFPSIFNANLETIQGNIPLPPLAMWDSDIYPQGSSGLWTLLPLTTARSAWIKRRKCFWCVLLFSISYWSAQWVWVVWIAADAQVSMGSLNNLNVPTFAPTLDLSLCH